MPDPKKQSDPDIPEGAKRKLGIDDGPQGGELGGGGPDVPLPPYAPWPGYDVNDWSPTVPPGVRIYDEARVGTTRGGEPLYQGTDQYGREWLWTYTNSIGYSDQAGIWHDVSRQDGVWRDEWTDKHGNEQDKAFNVDRLPIPDLPPGLTFHDHQEIPQRNGPFMNTATDQYGREWSWSRSDSGGYDISYYDTDGLKHEVMELNGKWRDTWTDKNGNQHTATQSPEGDWVAPPETPPYLHLRGIGEIPPDTGPYWTSQGDGLYTARDQYGRIWEWQRDADGNSKIGYTDGAGQTHEVSEGYDGSGYTDEAGQWHEGSEETAYWVDTWTDRDGNVHYARVFQDGTVHDSWYEEGTGEQHHMVWPPGETLYGQEPRFKKGDQDQGNEEQAGFNEDLDARFFANNLKPAADPGTEPPPGGGIVPDLAEGGVAPPPDVPGEPPVEPGQEAALAPEDADDGGIPGVGVPYEDFIPFNPMVKDPATGQWRNAEEGELDGPGKGEDMGLTAPGDDGGGIPPAPGEPPYVGAMPARVQDPTTGEWRMMVQDPATGQWRTVLEPAQSPKPPLPDPEGEAQPQPATQTPEPPPPPTQPGLTEAEEQALQEAGLTPEQMEWVEARVVDPGGTFTLEDPGFTDQQWDVLGGIWEDRAAQTSTPPPATEEPSIPRTPEGEAQQQPGTQAPEAEQPQAPTDPAPSAAQPSGQPEDQPADAPGTTPDAGGGFIDRLLQTLADDPAVLEAVAQRWGLEPEELKASAEEAAASRQAPGDDEPEEGDDPDSPTPAIWELEMSEYLDPASPALEGLSPQEIREVQEALSDPNNFRMVTVMDSYTPYEWHFTGREGLSPQQIRAVEQATASYEQKYQDGRIPPDGYDGLGLSDLAVEPDEPTTEQPTGQPEDQPAEEPGEEEGAPPPTEQFLPGEWDEVPPGTVEGEEAPAEPVDLTPSYDEASAREFRERLFEEPAEPVEDLGPPPFLPEYVEQELSQEHSETAEPEDEPDEGGGVAEEDASAPGEILNPDLFDPLAPGPTLDLGLAGRIEQNPQLVREVNQNEAVAEALERDPGSLDQIEQELGLAEPAGVAGPSGVMDHWGLTDPSLGEAPLPEAPTTPDQDLDDHQAGM